MSKIKNSKTQKRAKKYMKEFKQTEKANMKQLSNDYSQNSKQFLNRL